MAMWDGRFKKELDSKTNDFNSSIKFDSRLYKYDITGSIAHSKMLSKQGIISKEDEEKIIDGLTEILEDIELGKLEFDPEAEDIHMFVEAKLTEKIGDSGKKVHTARSRNDQVALDLKMYVKDEIIILKELVKNLIDSLVKKAEENLETVMPGYTHLQRAQPVTFAHHLMAYTQMLKRDYIRLENTYNLMDTSPIGSCALAGTSYNLDREYEKELLGFKAVTENSLDGVSDRDYIIELASNLSIIMMHLSRFSEEVILWCSHEFKFIELDDSFSTGSSIMPQKKNPDICELVRGKTGRVYGSLITLLTMMKGLPLAYNKDMQEDKEATFDMIDTVKNCLYILVPMIDTMVVLKDNMKKAAGKGFINATDAADFLVEKGMAFRDAYKVIGALVAYSIDKDKTLEELSLEEYKSFSEKFDDKIYEKIDLINCLKTRKVYGGPAPEAVKIQIENMKKFK